MKKSYLLIFAILFSCQQGFSQKTFKGKQKSIYQGSRSSSTIPSFQGGANTQNASLAKINQDQLIRLHKHYTRKGHANSLGFYLKRESYTAPSPVEVSTRSSLAQDEVFRWLYEAREVFPLENPELELSLYRDELDELSHYHMRYQQVYKGLEVYGAELNIHFKPDGQQSMDGFLYPTPAVNTQARLSMDQVTDIAFEHVEALVAVHRYEVKVSTLFSRPKNKSQLIIYPDPQVEGKFHLAYHLTIFPNFLHRYEYFVDAQSGAILTYYDHTCSIGPATAQGQHLNGQNFTFNTFDEGNGFTMLDVTQNMFSGNQNNPQQGDGFILTVDMQNTSIDDPEFTEVRSPNNQWSRLEVSAHVNAAISYNYFEQVHGRNSINGGGGDVVSFINVADEDGRGLDNAFWNGEFMFYGNGDVAFDPLAKSLDVGGHEMTHGVIQATANLVYQDQPGALNESFADVFAVMIDREDFQLGEDIVNPNVFRSGALRDLADPNNGGNRLGDNGWQPKHMDEIFTGTEDNGGVHINSGIPNHAFYLFAQSVGKERAERVYYRALSVYLKRSSDFQDCRIAVIQSAEDLYGTAEANAAGQAFDQVGILGPDSGGNPDPEPDPDEIELPSNPGEDFFIAVSEDIFDNAKIYRFNPDGTGRAPLSATTPKNPMSIQDDGALGAFVGDDNRIHLLILDPADPQEFVLTTEPNWQYTGNVWDNVAISKDGSRLAATTTFQDTSIYVFDIGSNSWARFELSNPTSAPGGLSSAGVLFADAIEWDFTGENILYDAFNRLENISGENQEYWDIGIINVWNNQSQTFANGGILKLFANLPDGVSIGNASFAKNSTVVIAFDYLDDNEDRNLILTANIERNEVVAIFENDVLGYPSYNQDDSEVIFTSSDFLDDPIIGSLPIAENRINITGDGTILLETHKWAVGYSTGSRSISVGVENELTQAGMKLYPNPVSDVLTLDLGQLTGQEADIRLLDVSGRQISHSTSRFSQAEIHMQGLSRGIYLIQLTVGEKQFFAKVLKE
ncbi:MAG: M4 family metallopeptidase [Bacteroidota bacterium]